jgi:hypothetical protein
LAVGKGQSTVIKGTGAGWKGYKKVGSRDQRFNEDSEGVTDENKALCAVTPSLLRLAARGSTQTADDEKQLHILCYTFCIIQRYVSEVILAL